MTANAPHVLAGPLPAERPGYDLDPWLDESAQPDLVRPAATLLAALLLLLAAIGGVVTGTR